MTKDAQSPALAMIQHVWNCRQECIGHSWQRLNSAMHQTVTLAIDAGLRFDLGDFHAIFNSFNSGYWIGDACGEDWYSLACAIGHVKACQSFEDFRKRPPFIVGGHRLCVGKEIDDCIAAIRVYGRTPQMDSAPEWLTYLHSKVTSFVGTDELIVCSNYHPTKLFKGYEGHESHWSDKPVRRWKVSRDEIAQANAAIKAQRKAAKKTEEAAA